MQLLSIQNTLKRLLLLHIHCILHTKRRNNKGYVSDKTLLLKSKTTCCIFFCNRHFAVDKVATKHFADFGLIYCAIGCIVHS